MTTRLCGLRGRATSQRRSGQAGGSRLRWHLERAVLGGARREASSARCTGHAGCDGVGCASRTTSSGWVATCRAAEVLAPISPPLKSRNELRFFFIRGRDRDARVEILTWILQDVASRSIAADTKWIDEFRHQIPPFVNILLLLLTYCCRSTNRVELPNESCWLLKILWITELLSHNFINAHALCDLVD
jgi:hypothetical protein